MGTPQIDPPSSPLNKLRKAPRISELSGVLQLFLCFGLHPLRTAEVTPDPGGRAMI